MDLVIDTNILFSILIKKSRTESLLFEEELHLFAPEFIFEEFEKYADLILDKTKRTRTEFDKLLDIFKQKIKIMPNEETEEIMLQAEKICPDKKDADYFALALRLKCPL